MLKKRIIPCLDIKNGRTVKGVNFEGIRDAGDPVELAQKYVMQGADELIFLDITATIEKRQTLLEWVRKVAREIHIPFTVGGGINTVSDVHDLLEAGADKVSINSSAIKNPELINKISSKFGSQCTVVAIDAKNNKGVWEVFVHGGRTPTGKDVLLWAKEAEQRGAGEILLTSMNNDGVKTGYALDITQKITNQINIPLIASGGAGKASHFRDVFLQTQATGALAASVFHFGEMEIPALKKYLKNQNIQVR